MKNVIAKLFKMIKCPNCNGWGVIKVAIGKTEKCSECKGKGWLSRKDYKLIQLADNIKLLSFECSEWRKASENLSHALLDVKKTLYNLRIMADEPGIERHLLHIDDALSFYYILVAKK